MSRTCWGGARATCALAGCASAALSTPKGGNFEIALCDVPDNAHVQAPGPAYFEPQVIAQLLLSILGTTGVEGEGGLKSLEAGRAPTDAHNLCAQTRNSDRGSGPEMRGNLRIKGRAVVLYSAAAITRPSCSSAPIRARCAIC